MAVEVEAPIVTVQTLYTKHQETGEVVITVVEVMVLVLVNLHKMMLLCQSMQFAEWMELVVAVSYTHLTLPTIQPV